MAKDSTVERDAISKAGEVQALAYAKSQIASAFQQSDSENARPITTAYLENGEVKKKLTAMHPNSAMMRAFGHMAMNHYGADVVQVYSTDTGRLYCEFVLHKDGKLETTFKADPKNFDDPLRKNVVRATAFFL
jgi:hypothetical protein